MDKKTEGVEFFVKEVLTSIPAPYGEDIILKVFQEIEKNADWERTYHSLSNDVGDGWSDDDSKEKRAIGQTWDEKSDGNCLFKIPKGPDWNTILAKLK